MQLKFHMVTIEDLVPEGHFLRKLDTVLDLGFVYEEMAHLYSRRLWAAAHRPGGAGEISAGGLSVRNTLRASDSSSESRRMWPCGGIWDWICLTGCRITVRFSQLRRRKPNFRKNLPASVFFPKVKEA